jgi:hypothetical protein
MVSATSGFSNLYKSSDVPLIEGVKMGFIVLPAVIFAFFMSILSVQKAQSAMSNPASVELQSSQSGQTFVSYQRAVAAYMQTNPTFIGTVSSAALTTQKTPFSASFLAIASNAVTATAGGGRVVTSFAALPTGALRDALNISDNDLSLGLASGANWISAAYGATAVPLSTAVPSGNVVSVIQIGN